MFNHQMKSRSHLLFLSLVAFIMLGIIWYISIILGLLMTLLLLAAIFQTIQQERRNENEIKQHIASLSDHVEDVGEEVLLDMPIGMIIYNDDYYVEWMNPHMNHFFETDMIGKPLEDISDQLIPAINENKENVTFKYGDYGFQVIIRKDDRLLYVLDRTEQLEIETLYDNEHTILAIIYLDNYDELTRNMDDTLKSQLNSKVTSALNEWSRRFGLYLKRTSQEQFLAVGTNAILTELEESKFAILDEVRELDTMQNVPLTISIGIGYGNTSLPELGVMAHSSLNLALGRGGDQVAIKDETGKARFYGGKTNPMEKSTMVRARVISHALTGLIKASDHVFIMGHQVPDMDAIGSAIGILHIARANGKSGYIVIDSKDVHTGVYRLLDAVKEDEDLWPYFVEPKDAHERITQNSLIVVVDTHRPSMVVDESLLSKTDYKVVIDHHRRAEDFIDNPTLVYMEPYASSTSELVTELFEYQPKDKKLSILEASALLAGIVVDTKSFTLRTGSRTFAAASYLRSKGADTVLVQKFLKEDFESYIHRSRLIETAEVYEETIAIAKAAPGHTFGSVLIAQTADTLLTMSGISASFVISEREDGKIGISARSLGKINVQVIMEKLGGGGHLTNAATQIEGTTVDEVEQKLKTIIDEYIEGRNET
ncbi:MAG TPA: DHH family phosphoesterase [Cerasibacillus sp.]|uniref:DHH family phosphoesterase n=1 Tax=Cerasibacillus sp. TaxID=2498711 RepID=UPI002F42AE43